MGWLWFCIFDPNQVPSIPGTGRGRALAECSSPGTQKQVSPLPAQLGPGSAAFKEKLVTRAGHSPWVTGRLEALPPKGRV